MTFTSFSSDFITGSSVQAAQLAEALVHDGRRMPSDEQLAQFGRAILNETLDLLADSPLENFTTTLCEGLIGGLHSVAQRLERDADKSRSELQRLMRDFDGSEVADTELQEVLQASRRSDAAAAAIETARDAAAAAYGHATGEAWTPWRGSVKASRTTAAQIEAKDALRSAKARRTQSTDAGATVVAFRGSPTADTAEDANRIFDALNWAKAQWPDMALATTGLKGAERLAIRWAQQHGVTLVLAKADFNRNGRAAPFRANDEMLDLDPTCVLTLATTLNPARAEGLQPFGPALSLAQKAGEKGLRHIPIKARA